jgi:hypothetical protein
LLKPSIRLTVDEWVWLHGKEGTAQCHCFKTYVHAAECKHPSQTLKPSQQKLLHIQKLASLTRCLPRCGGRQGKPFTAIKPPQNVPLQLPTGQLTKAQP